MYRALESHIRLESGISSSLVLSLHARFRLSDDPNRLVTFVLLPGTAGAARTSRHRRRAILDFDRARGDAIGYVRQRKTAGSTLHHHIEKVIPAFSLLPRTTLIRSANGSDRV